MDTKFYTISHDTFGTKGSPWISTITNGLSDIVECSKCRGISQYPTGELTAKLEFNKGTKWTDVLGCGHYPLLIFSSRVIDAFYKENLLNFSYHKILFENPLPKKLDEKNMPEYFWVDGSKMLGGNLDLEASNPVKIGFCSKCDRILYNISKTFDRKQKGFGCVLKNNTWNGNNLFVTDLSETLFFCTDEILECAKKYKLTNFCLIPAENGHQLHGIKYLK